MRSARPIIAVAGVAALAAAGWLLLAPPGGEDPGIAAETLVAEGARLVEAQRYDEALEVLARVPTGSPAEARALYYRGAALNMLKDYAAATVELERALALAPQDPGIRYALGVAYYRLGKITLAKGYFASVLEINPEDRHARGLMDVMAKLERRTADEATRAAAADAEDAPPPPP